MYVVIFTATVSKLDDNYSDLAKNLREKAMADYGCTDFISLTQANQEVALSYWPDLESIKRWKRDELHMKAQGLGKGDWYKGYRVDVCQVVRSYGRGIGFEQCG